jgi:hypothetical protein
MIVVEQLDSQSINTEIEKGVKKDTIATAVAYTGYNDLELILKEHKAINTSRIVKVHTYCLWFIVQLAMLKRYFKDSH